MDEIFKPLLSGTTPSPPKFNVIVTWSALAPMDEKNQTPNITFANTRAETLRFGGTGVQNSACCRVWIFCPSTVVHRNYKATNTTMGLCRLSPWHHMAPMIRSRHRGAWKLLSGNWNLALWYLPYSMHLVLIILAFFGNHSTYSMSIETTVFDKSKLCHAQIHSEIPSCAIKNTYPSPILFY
jgi:hypothetical protein